MPDLMDPTITHYTTIPKAGFLNYLFYLFFKKEQDLTSEYKNSPVLQEIVPIRAL